MLRAETWFLALCQGRTVEELDLRALDDFRRCQSELEQAQQAFIATPSESDLAREVTFQIRDHPYHLPVWQLLVQAFEHSTHHRAELGLLLGQMGHSLPTLDIIVHFLHASGQPWPPN